MEFQLIHEIFQMPLQYLGMVCGRAHIQGFSMNKQGMFQMFWSNIYSLSSILGTIDEHILQSLNKNREKLKDFLGYLRCEGRFYKNFLHFLEI